MASPPDFESGSCVEVFGLASDGGKLLNGKKGIVSNRIGFKDRLEVRLGPDKKVSLKPENLRPGELSVQERLVLLGLQPAPAASDGDNTNVATDSSPKLVFKPGDQVEIFGLLSESGQVLNGQHGSVVQFLEGRSRFEVRLADAGVANVKPENLRKRTGAPASAEKADGQPRPRSRSRSRLRGVVTDPSKAPAGAETAAVAEAAGAAEASKAAGATEAGGAGAAEGFRPGQCVEVFGLESESGRVLNGQTGIVSRCLDSSGRVEVRFAEKTVALRAACLRQVTFSFGAPEAAEAAAEVGGAPSAPGDAPQNDAAT